MYLSFTSIMGSQCRAIIVRQNWANREWPKVSFQCVCGLGETALHGTRSTPRQPLSPATLREEQEKQGLLEAAHTTRIQSWSSLWLEQCDTARVILHISKSTLCRSCFVQEEIRKMSHHQLAWRLWMWHLRSQSRDQFYLYWVVQQNLLFCCSTVSIT